MAVLKFPYICQIQGTVEKMRCDRPLINFTLHSSGNDFPTQGWIDSGCTMTHVDADIAKELGLDISVFPEVETGGIHGTGVGYLSELEFEIPGGGDAYTGPVVFVENLFVPVLLGQDNFFEKFNISFKKSSGYFTIERVK